jgi:hypothetical protein
MFAVPASHAAVINTFTNRATFNGAVGPTTVEDFNSFGSEVPFHTTPLDVGPFTFFMTGSPVTTPPRNSIELPPLVFPEFNVDGTTIANVRTIGGDSLFLSFDKPTLAFGADFASFNDSSLRTQIVVDGELVTPPVTAGEQVRFFGFETDRFFSTVEFRGISADGYAMDNVVTHLLNEFHYFFIQSIEVTTSNVILTWSSASNQFYSVSSLSNLPSGNLQTVDQNIPATPPINVFTNITPTSTESRNYVVGVGLQVPEACCFGDGSCSDLRPEDCLLLGATPWGPGTTCAYPGVCQCYSVVHISDITFRSGTHSTVGGIFGLGQIVNLNDEPLELSTVSISSFSDDHPTITVTPKILISQGTVNAGHRIGSLSPVADTVINNSGLAPEPEQPNIGANQFNLGFNLSGNGPGEAFTVTVSFVITVADSDIPLSIAITETGESGSNTLNAATRVESCP